MARLARSSRDGVATTRPGAPVWIGLCGSAAAGSGSSRWLWRRMPHPPCCSRWMDKPHCNKAAQPSRGWRVALAGSLVASVLAAHESQQAACAPKRKAGTGAATKKKAPRACAACRPGCVQPGQDLPVEKFIA